MRQFVSRPLDDFEELKEKGVDDINNYSENQSLAKNEEPEFERIETN